MGVTKMVWKYDDEQCICVDVESEEHVWFDCNLYIDVRRRWKEKMNAKHADLYDVIQCYDVNNEWTYIRRLTTYASYDSPTLRPGPRLVYCTVFWYISSHECVIRMQYIYLW